jgi:hypothetical protein
VATHQGFEGNFIAARDEALQELPVRQSATIRQEDGPAERPEKQGLRAGFWRKNS